MTLREATEIHTNENYLNPNYTDADRKRARQLCYSALQTFLFARSGGSWDPHALLPGETSETSTYAQERIPSF